MEEVQAARKGPAVLGYTTPPAGQRGEGGAQESASTGGVCTSQGGSHLGAIEPASWGALRYGLVYAAPTHARELEGGSRPTQCNK